MSVAIVRRVAIDCSLTTVAAASERRRRRHSHDRSYFWHFRTERRRRAFLALVGISSGDSDHGGGGGGGGSGGGGGGGDGDGESSGQIVNEYHDRTAVAAMTRTRRVQKCLRRRVDADGGGCGVARSHFCSSYDGDRPPQAASSSVVFPRRRHLDRQPLCAAEPAADDNRHYLRLTCARAFCQPPLCAQK